MKKYIQATLFLLAAVLILSACQPTPDRPVVVNKADNGLEQQIKETASPTSSASKEGKWQETIDEGGVHLVIDADIEVPEVSAWPVIKTTKHIPSVQEAQKAVDTLMEGKTLYEDNSTRSKADVEQDIVWVKGKIKEAASDDTIDKDGYESELEQYQKEYNESPDKEPVKKKAAVAFKNIKCDGIGADYSFSAEADLGNSARGKLSVYYSDKYLFSGMSYTVYKNDYTSYELFDAKDTLPGLSISKEQALKTAQDTLNKLGLDDVHLSDTKAGIDLEGLKHSAYSSKASDPGRKKCFVFYFGRVVQGVPVTNVEYCNGWQLDGDGKKEEDYDTVWPSEDIQIAVDETGILWFKWHDPGDIGETVNANVKLKDIEEIKSIFKKQMFYQRTWTANADKKNVITIKRIVLGLMRVRMKENEFAYMPVWDFIGDWDTDGNFDFRHNLSFLTINALGGSVINRYLGY